MDKVLSVQSRACPKRSQTTCVGDSRALSMPRAESSENQVLPMTADTCRVSVEQWMRAVPSCNLTDLDLASLWSRNNG